MFKQKLEKTNPLKTDFIRELGPVNIDTLREAVLKLSENDWQEANKNKPNNFDALSQVSHMVFRFIDSYDDHRSFYDTPLWNDWQPLITPVLHETISNIKYANYIFPRIMLARLPAGTKIDTHSDKSLAARFPHKIHVPLLTNENTFFYLKKKPFHFKPGYGYEVNNNIDHHVENNGNTDRIHLIFEYAPDV